MHTLPLLKILLVDDRPENLLAMEAALQSMDAELVRAESGKEALSSLMRYDFAAIVLDVNMPEMNGIEVASLIRSNKKTCHIPIIFATGHGRDDANMFNGYEAGAVDYLVKPIDPIILRAKLNVFLELYAQKSELSALNDHYRDEIEKRESVEAELECRLEQLEAVNLQLDEKNTDLDEFTSMASHDLQAPIRKLISFSQLLRKEMEEDLSDDAKQYLTIITDAATRMNVLIQDLLLLSRVGRAAMNQDRVSLNSCIDQVLDVLSLRIEECNAKIIRDNLPDVIGDKTMLTQLYQNLLSNALKFVEQGSPEVHFTAERDGQTWILGVRDNGIGMEMESAKEIFKPFRRLHNRTEYEGTGIGLSICKKAVDCHEGRIWVESELGQGTHFRFTLKAYSPFPGLVERHDEQVIASVSLQVEPDAVE